MMTTVMIPRGEPGTGARRARRVLPLAVALVVSGAAMAWGGWRGFGTWPVDPADSTRMARGGEALVRAQQALAGTPPAMGDRSTTIAPGPRLAFTTIMPCRIADTRVAGGPVDADTALQVVTMAVDYSAQGGIPSGCGLDAAAAEAVMVNITVVAPERAGYATAYPPGEARPLAASLNYAPGAIVNNTVVAKVATAQRGRPFALYSYARTHVVVDLVGYYTAPPPPRGVAIACTDVRIARSVDAGRLFLEASEPSCPAGYTAMSAGCESQTSGSPGHEGQATIDWTTSGLVWAGFPPATRVACVGRDMVPWTVGGSTPVTVVQHCCRVVALPAP